jgi:hypothetical protein
MVLKVGGQALADGVLMRTDRAWAVARSDGAVVSGELSPPWWPRVPLGRVLGGLCRGLWLAFGRAGRRGEGGRRRGSPMLRALLAAEATVLALTWLLGRARLPSWGHPLAGIGLWVAAIGVFRLVAPEVQWRYHGAEHKAVTAYERGVDLGDLGSVLACPRVHPRCGTNLVVWLALCAPLISRLPGVAQLAALPVALAIVAEVLTVSARHPGAPLSRLVLAPGAAVQRWVTTQEPSAAEQRVGCAALRACLDRHQEVVGNARLEGTLLGGALFDDGLLGSGAHRPFQRGGRFSAKARGPST